MGELTKEFPFTVQLKSMNDMQIASGAGADRMSTGMKCSFGKPIGIAAQVNVGQVLFQIHTSKGNIAFAKEALRRAGSKLPCSTRIDVVEKKEQAN
jgi:large subunit ribosomal protein L10e